MVEELQDLIDLCESAKVDLRLSVRERELAARLAAQMHDGVVPNTGIIKRLRKALTDPVICAKLLEDRSCLWLRKHAASQGLRVPKANEKVYCKRQLSGLANSTYADCEGYRPRRPEEEFDNATSNHVLSGNIFDRG
jgi:hypothetical protein